MMKLKKISALVLAIMMIALVGLAFAADMDGESGRIGEFVTPDTATTQTDTVVIYKEITAYNPESCTVNAPTITYNYTIGGATVATGTKITDNASHHNQINGTDVNVEVAVKAGVGTPTITGVTASNSTAGNGALHITPEDQLKASEYGMANRFPITIDFSGINYTTAGSGAGVYRYVISETTTANKNTAGIEEGEVANDLYMDVYVDGSGDIYGYVLFTDNESIDGSTSDATASTDAGKTEGFVGSKPDEGTYTSSELSTADKYYTFSLTLTKVVENDAYAVSTHHQFPFTVTLTNTTVTADVLPIMTVGTNATQAALSAGAIAGTWNPAIASGATVTYVGIPCGTTITVKETNDVTGVSYNSVSTNADTDAAPKAINYNEDSNTATINCNATALTAANENHTAASSKVVTFTNTLLQISPTGYVSRYAPYGLMLIAGIAMVVILVAKRRKHTDED